MASPTDISLTLDKFDRSVQFMIHGDEPLSALQIEIAGNLLAKLDFPDPVADVEGKVICPDEVQLKDDCRISRLDAKGKQHNLKRKLAGLTDATPARVIVSRAQIDFARRALYVFGYALETHKDQMLGVYLNGEYLGNAKKRHPRPDLKRKNNFLSDKLGFLFSLEKKELVDMLTEKPDSRIEVRLEQDGTVIASANKPVAPIGDAGVQMKIGELRIAARRKFRKADMKRLEFLIASDAFRRRWAVSRDTPAWHVREELVIELSKRLEKEDEIAIRLSNGDRVLCRPVADTGLGRAFLRFGEDERGFLDWVAGQTRPGDITIDVGGAYGTVSRAMARKGATVYTIEADPNSCNRIFRTGTEFGQGSIHVTNAAASNEPGEVDFAGTGNNSVGVGKILDSDSAEVVQGYLDELSKLNRVPLRHVDPNAKFKKTFTTDDFDLLKVRAITLDDFCREKELKDIALVKLDIEGGELMAIRGAQGLLDGAYGRPPIVVFEHSTRFSMRGGEPDDVLREFFDRGWSLFVLESGKNKGGRPIPLLTIEDAPEHDNIIAYPPGHPDTPAVEAENQTS